MNKIKRIFLFIGILVVLYFGVLMIGGGIIGVMIGLKSPKGPINQEAINTAATHFVAQYNSTIFSLSLLLAAVGAFGARWLTLILAAPVAVVCFLLMNNAPPQPPAQPVADTSQQLLELPNPQEIEDAKKKAAALYPQLGIAGSPLNREFIRRYHNYQAEDKNYFNDPDWPIKLAKECNEAFTKP